MGKLNTKILVDESHSNLKVFDQYEEERQDIIESKIAEAESAVAEQMDQFLTNGIIYQESDEAGEVTSTAVPEPEYLVVAAVDEVLPEWDEAAEHSKDDAKFMAELRETSEEVKQATELVDQLKAALKDAKAELAVASKRLQRLAATGPTYRTKPEPKQEPDPTTNDLPEMGDPFEDEPEESTEWRSIKTDTLLEGIERLGAKKRESIIDACPTLGDLEDLRGEASKQFKQFKDLLPKGIGDGIASELEERMIEAMSRNGELD
jgi:hypothetical protein